MLWYQPVSCMIFSQYGGVASYLEQTANSICLHCAIAAFFKIGYMLRLFHES